MNWTTDKPTQKGHYWWCEYKCSDVMPIYVGETNGKLWAWFNGYEDKLERMKGWFMGPIDVPNPPEG